jgi:beta-lactamase regulating signal transducer with metallopeptidase domain
VDVSLPAHAAAPWLAPALWLVLRGTVLLALAALAALALRRASAATRHLAWALALSGMLALPALTLAAPRWELPWLHVVPLDAPAFIDAAAVGEPGDAGIPWGTVVLAVWAVGALITLGRYAVAVVTVRLIARRAHAVTDGPWMERVREAGAELGMREPVRLLQAEGAAMPMTWGILRPVVLVPAEADGWTAERARVVLLHELAHVARRDCLWQTVARLACAAYWFHPGVWWAAQQMHVEREQACDDQVLAAGTRPSDYAGHLLEVARAFRTRPLTAAAAVAMAARRSQLEGRVVAVLDAARSRGRVPVRAAVVAGGVAAVALFPLAAASPDGYEPPPPAPVAPVAAADAPAPPLEYTVEAAPPADERAVSVPLASAEGLRLTVRVPKAQAAREAEKPYPEPFPELAVGDAATLAALLRASNDADPEVRRSAVWALGRMDGGGVVGSLVRSMNDTDARVRSAAAMALGEYAERQETTRIAARRPGSDSARVPTGSAPAAGPPPRAARTDIGAGGGPSDPGLHILQGLMEEDTASSPSVQ